MAAMAIQTKNDHQVGTNLGFPEAKEPAPIKFPRKQKKKGHAATLIEVLQPGLVYLGISPFTESLLQSD